MLIFFDFKIVLFAEVKDVLLNRIEHEYICCNTDLVSNGRF